MRSSHDQSQQTSGASYPRQPLLDRQFDSNRDQNGDASGTNRSTSQYGSYTNHNVENPGPSKSGDHHSFYKGSDERHHKKQKDVPYSNGEARDHVLRKQSVSFDRENLAFSDEDDDLTSGSETGHSKGRTQSLDRIGDFAHQHRPICSCHHHHHHRPDCRARDSSPSRVCQPSGRQSAPACSRLRNLSGSLGNLSTLPKSTYGESSRSKCAYKDRVRLKELDSDTEIKRTRYFTNHVHLSKLFAILKLQLMYI